MRSPSWFGTSIKVAGQVSWLVLLYGGLIYMAVGTMAVSQITGRFGDNSAYIFTLAEIATNEQVELHENTKEMARRINHLQDARDNALFLAIAAGEAIGISRDQINNVVENGDLSKYQAASSGQGEQERQFAEQTITFRRLDLELKTWQTRYDQAQDNLKKGLSGFLEDEFKKLLGGVSENEFQVAAATATALRVAGFAWLFAMPAEVLTLLLALAMGGLGSTLQITKVFLEDDAKYSVLWYMFRPGQGMVTAFVMFVFLKGGQLTIGSADNQALNPFFVAFAGIVSGLLSHDAYRLIERAGGKLIPNSGDAAPRWAFKLRDALTQAQVDVATLAAGVGVPSEQVGAWMDEKEPVPYEQQKLVASWLRMPMREIFTSEPPPGYTAKASQGNEAT